jgi:hypothetical protein
MSRYGTLVGGLALVASVSSCAAPSEAEPSGESHAALDEHPVFSHPANAPKGSVNRVTWEGTSKDGEQHYGYLKGGAWIFPGRRYEMLYDVTLLGVREVVMFEANKAAGAYEFTSQTDNDHWGWVGSRCRIRGYPAVLGVVAVGHGHGNHTLGPGNGTAANNCEFPGE